MQTPYPNLFIIGAAKAGTTSLYEYLNAHSQVFMSPVKEPHYFSRVAQRAETASYGTWIHSEEEYLALFKGAAGYPIVGEASTSYLWAAQTPENILAKSPRARIIVLLRDPVARAYSHYLMDVRANRQSLPFYEALREDFDRPRKGWHISNLYVELGLYHQQLMRYQESFEPDRLLILLFDALRDEPQATLKRAAQFLDIDGDEFETLAPVVHNPYLAPTGSLQKFQASSSLTRMIRTLLPLNLRASLRNRFLMRPAEKPVMDERAVAFLKEIYEPEMAALEEMLGYELPALRQSWDS